MKKLSDYRVGQRVQLHPATDLWMRGDRYGTVTAIGRKYVHIRPDRCGKLGQRIVYVTPENILEVVE